MIDLNAQVFIVLFKDAYAKCFGYAMVTALTETESKLFCNQLLEKTGLVIGWKTVKNYAAFILDSSSAKEENPSVATLDTLARYVLDAPYTDEIKRKNTESHYPYWFQYKEQFYKTNAKTNSKKLTAKLIAGVVVLILIIGFLIYFFPFTTLQATYFSDNFHSLNEDSLTANGWFIQNKDAAYWNKRNDKPEYLTLYTLRGDNWPDSSYKPAIKNLLLRKINADCFSTEIHLKDFVPQQNWQQAGILLLEDTAFAGKSVRLSLAYNDFSGGYPTSRQVLIQAITSLGKKFHQPEEVAHKPVLFLDSLKDNPALINNLQNSVLRIEKQGNTLRFYMPAAV